MFDAIGTDFETEQSRVIAKLKARFPDKFTTEKALVRDLEVERNILESIECVREEVCKTCNGVCDVTNPKADENCVNYIPF